MAPRAYAMIVGGLLATVAFFALIFPVNIAVDGIITDSVECGSGFSGLVDKKPIGAPADWQTKCDDAVSTRQGWGWGLFGVGLLVLTGGMVVQTPSREETAS